MRGKRHGVCSNERAGLIWFRRQKGTAVLQETNGEIVAPSAPSERKVEAIRPNRRRRVAAAGKALLVWLGTGSIGAAIVAYIIFKLAGC
jgi:hypothetical protein